MLTRTMSLRCVALPLAAVVLASGCAANVTSGSFYAVHIGEDQRRVVDDLQRMGVEHVWLVPRDTPIGTSLATAAELDLDGSVDVVAIARRQAAQPAGPLHSASGPSWEFEYNDRLGRREVRLEFENAALSRIHVRWYPPAWFSS